MNCPAAGTAERECIPHSSGTLPPGVSHKIFVQELNKAPILGALLTVFGTIYKFSHC